MGHRTLAQQNMGHEREMVENRCARLCHTPVVSQVKVVRKKAHVNERVVGALGSGAGFVASMLHSSTMHANY